MNATITPRKLRGSIRAIASKSYAQRHLIASLLADADFDEFDDACDDVIATRKALEALRRGATTIDIASSGTSARILLQVLAARYPGVSLKVSDQLGKRPLKTFIANPAKSGVYRVSGDESSQYLSGLLFALPLLDGQSRIELSSPLQSAGYVDMTLEVLARYGIHITTDGAHGWTIDGNQTYVKPPDPQCEPDWSSAPVWLSAGAEVRGLDRDTLQPDGIAFLPYVIFEGDTARLDPCVSLPSIIDVSQFPDLTPVLAVMAATRDGQVRFVGTRRLRIKESDRIASMYALLKALGADASLEGDDLLVRGTRSLRGGVVDAHEDHRIVMAATLASCWCHDPVTIRGADAVAKSYPRFFDDFKALGGAVEFS